MASSLSRATATSQVKYDVFISFRGKDTRYKFTNHLHAALCRQKILTFVDDQLKRGDNISVSLFDTIKASKISVVIFSENYAESRWCLLELEQILDHHRAGRQIVIPVFYHVDPTNVKHQYGAFGVAFCNLEKRIKKRLYNLEGLKATLVEAAHLSEWTIDDEKLETLSIDAIVGDILKKLNSLKHQDGTFEAEFADKLEECYKKRLKDLKRLKADLDRWKSALEEAGNLSGWTVDGKTLETALIDATVGDILNKLNEMSPNDNMDLVGVELSIQKVESLLCTWSSSDVHIVGIWGIGGIGKTSIGRAVFNKISKQFEGSYFAENVREKSEKSDDLTYLKEEIFDKILDDRHANIELSYTKERLRRTKVILAFDDVTCFEQIKKLIGDFANLGSGSRIIITTRDKQVLKNCEVDDANIYEVKGLFDNDALQLFRRFAFGQNCPIEDYAELSNKILLYAKGVPLALKVLGSFLCGKTKQDWESEMEKLEKYPHQDIQRVLKISYDGLDDEDKSIFLDIAFFFKGWRTYIVIDILNASDFSTQIGLSHLVDKSLISISDDTIDMHDLLQEMGREIVRKECDEPGKRSRLWYHKDINNVLKYNKGTGRVQGISLDISKISQVRLKRHAFAEMYSLRLFEVYNSQDQENYQNKLRGFEDLESFSSELTYFNWKAYPSRSLPLDFSAENLVKLDMQSSNVKQLWDDVQELQNLKYFNLTDSTHLIEIPNLSKAINLQELILDGCTNLVEITPSVRNLYKLVELSLSNCDSLSIVPDGIQSTYMSLSGCSNLMIAPKISCKVEVLDLSRTAIKESPFIEYPSRLARLNLSHCPRLESVSRSTCECSLLKFLCLNECPKLRSVPDNIPSKFLSFSGCSNLMMAPKIAREVEQLDLSQTAIKESPFIEYPSRLAKLNLSHCLMLEGLSSSICECKLLKILYLNECPKLKCLPNDFGKLEELEILETSGTVFREVPSSITQLGKLSSLCLSRRMDQEPLNWLPTSLSGLRCLKSLKLANCRIKMLPDDLGQLYLLETLDLSGNNFESMPAMKTNSKLEVLYISHCKNLTSLPELPSSICVAANNCSSLESISDLSFLFSPMKWPQRVNFANCFKLDLSEILLQESRRRICNAVCYPGNEIPKWFRYQKEGSFITLEQPPNWNKKSFLGYIMSAVVAFPDRYDVKRRFEVSCVFFIKREDEFETYECPLRCWFGYGSEINKECIGPLAPHYIESNHVFLGFDYKARESFYGDIPLLDHDMEELGNVVEEMGIGKMLIKFRIHDSNGNLKVKQCGVHFLFTQEEKDKAQSNSRHLSDKNEEGEVPQSKESSFSSSFEDESSTSRFISKYDDEDEDEDKEEPHHKRFGYEQFLIYG